MKLFSQLIRFKLHSKMDWTSRVLKNFLWKSDFKRKIPAKIQSIKPWNIPYALSASAFHLKRFFNYIPFWVLSVPVLEYPSRPIERHSRHSFRERWRTICTRLGCSSVIGDSTRKLKDSWHLTDLFCTPNNVKL